MLTEAQIQRSFTKLFQEAEISPELCDRAEELIDELRLEGPLRHRLSQELEELRDICLANNS